ncbi:hypothetical protein Nepgr_003978 [Nepenthes gracilis]|uniref:Uncharacterized protein n=1 Tax=Nepenthes gracilis TaxID=150966 RepID=A0AAD3S0M8_NEPGR|nr:hypothetical protein Nepgr_003978 [Nepenthes gracilis]
MSITSPPTPATSSPGIPKNHQSLFQPTRLSQLQQDQRPPAKASCSTGPNPSLPAAGQHPKSATTGLQYCTNKEKFNSRINRQLQEPEQNQSFKLEAASIQLNCVITHQQHIKPPEQDQVQPLAIRANQNQHNNRSEAAFSSQQGLRSAPHNLVKPVDSSTIPKWRIQLLVHRHICISWPAKQQSIITAATGPAE